MQSMTYSVSALAGVAIILSGCMTSNQSANPSQDDQTMTEEQRQAVEFICREEDTDHESAVAACNTLIEIEQDAEILWRFYNNRGVHTAHLGDIQQAIEDYTQALAIYPNAISYGNRGAEHTGLEQFDSALQDFNDALELDPNLAWVKADRGHAFYLMGDYQQAISDLNEAIAGDPTLSRAHHYRGSAHCALGNQSQAVSDWLRSYALMNSEQLRLEQRRLSYRGFYAGPIDGTNSLALREAIELRAVLGCSG